MPACPLLESPSGSIHVTAGWNGYAAGAIRQVPELDRCRVHLRHDNQRTAASTTCCHLSVWHRRRRDSALTLRPDSLQGTGRLSEGASHATDPIGCSLFPWL